MGTPQKYLDISTGHLQQSTLNPPHPGYLIAEYQHGAFYYVPDLENMYEDTPSDLAAVFEFARANDCWLIRFDSIADVFDELPTYDW